MVGIEQGFLSFWLRYPQGSKREQQSAAAAAALSTHNTSHLVSTSQRSKSNLLQLLLQLLPSADSNSVPLLHRSKHKYFQIAIASAFHICTLYIRSYCQHIDHTKTNEPKKLSGSCIFFNTSMYLYFSQKSKI